MELLVACGCVAVLVKADFTSSDTRRVISTKLLPGSSESIGLRLYVWGMDI
jgi:hypothetical protein